MEPISIILLDESEDIFVPTGDHSIEEVLVSICEKHGLNPSRYVLSYDNYFLPKEYTLKTLNLQKDQRLKLVEDFRPTPDQCVTITLKVKDSHVSAKFRPNVTLWKVVENLIAAVTLKIPCSTPILIRQGVEYIGREDMMRVTPRSLGFTSGFLYFRFLVIENSTLSKRTGGLLGSMESLQLELNKDLDDGAFIHKVSTHTSYVKGQQPVIKFYPGIARRNSSVFGEIHYLGDRNAVACRLPYKKLSARQKTRRDQFYSMHIKDVQTMFKLIIEKRKELRERLLWTEDPNQKKSPTENIFTVIRIHFPDKTILQGFFKKDDPVNEVAEFVKLYRRVPRKFQLIIGPPKTILHSEKTLAEYGLAPTGKMFYKVVEEEQPQNMAYLKENVLRKLTTHEAACYAAALCHHLPAELFIKKEPKVKRKYPDERVGLSVSKKIESLTDTRPFVLRPYASRTSYFRT
ncbi:unnamed protein product [Nezara viridula]|uniref:UBX domain-containing protein n=1 Tax=Nezara viridula TaxID=85310 RepID=A0A9P0MHH3_NEZVI|nr:unnamed protein product [Nezara viridula]